MGHYRTFDGKTYDLKSHCEYTLIEQINNTVTPKLLINYKNDQVNHPDKPADGGELTIKVLKTVVSIKQGQTLTVNSMMPPDQTFYKNNDVTVRKVNSFFFSVEGN